MDHDPDTRHRCPACGEDRLRPWRAATSSEPALSSRASYELLRCDACGTAALPPGAQSASLYEKGSYAEPADAWRPLALATRRLVTWDRRRMLGELRPASRVLEVGAGRGELLVELAAQGHRVAGLEPAGAGGAVARAEGIEVSSLPLERFEREPKSCDLIVFWHVLEHLDVPLAALERVRPWLTPGGRLVVAVPNLRSLQARIGGDRWFHQDVPRHRTQFTPAGLDRLLLRAGFVRIRRRHPLIDQNPLGMWITLLNRLTAGRDIPLRLVKRARWSGGRATAARDAAVVAVGGSLLLLPAVAMELAATVAGRGGTIVVECSSRPG